MTNPAHHEGDRTSVAHAAATDRVRVLVAEDDPSLREAMVDRIGLYLARRIMEHHGGSIAYRDRLDGGSTFVLTLLRSEQETER